MILRYIVLLIVLKGEFTATYGNENDKVTWLVQPAVVAYSA